MLRDIHEITKRGVSTFVDAFDLANTPSLLNKAFILFLAFIAPVAKVILAVLFLIFVDLITGLWASVKEKQTITSSALSRTIGKIFIYSTTIIVAYVMNKYLLVDFNFPIESIVSGFIAITEGKSILENMNRLSDNSLIDDLILIFSNEREKKLPPKPVKKKKDD